MVCTINPETYQTYKFSLVEPPTLYMMIWKTYNAKSHLSHRTERKQVFRLRFNVAAFIYTVSLKS